MFEAQVLPRLRPVAGRCVRTRALHTIGLGESDLAMRLGSMMARDRVPLVGTTASGGVVSIRLRYEGPLPPDDADALLDSDERTIRAMVGANVFAKGDETLAHAVVRGLRASSKTLALVESCTGGGLASRVTDVPGASAVLLAGWIPYSNDAKQRDLGVAPSIFVPGAHGAVSHECARALALGGLTRSGATHCLAITGIAGPSGGHADKPVGTVFISLAKRADAGAPPLLDSRRFLFPGDRSSIRDWAARSTLAMLWMHLSGTPDAPLLRQVEQR
jgi:nicotinamide-nucleotide amidase